MDGAASMQNSAPRDMEMMDNISTDVPVSNAAVTDTVQEPQSPAKMFSTDKIHPTEGKSSDTYLTVTSPSIESGVTATVSEPEVEFDPQSTPRDPTTKGSFSSCSSDENPADSCETTAMLRISLDTIPVEILLFICDYLEAAVIINTMSKVCRSFHDLFVNEAYWRCRLTKRWPKKYPPVDYDGIDWQRMCMERERCHRVWSQPEEHTEYFVFNDSLFAAVDVVHLMQEGRFLATGSRDRYLTLLDLTKYDSSRPETKKEMKRHCINKAHNGWIWSMASLDNCLYTGSWDTKIKVWDLGQDFKTVTTYKCKSAVLDLHVEPNFLVASGFDKKVYFIDPREGNIISTKRWHRQPVLCIAADENYIISGSEDKTFCVYDRRAGMVFKSVVVENYPMDISYHSNQLWFGDKMGCLTLMDTSMGKFDVVQTYDVGHKDKLTGVIHTEGAIFTSSNDKDVKVLEPSLDPKPITTLQKHNNGVAGIAYQNGVLASAGCDICVGIWRPKNDWGWST